MSGRKVIVGVCMLCALALSAIAAQGAAAETNGTTAFTCKKVTPAKETVGFSDAHCKSPVSTFAEYEHFPFEENTTTELEGSNETTEGVPSIAKLTSVQAGVELELQAEVVEKAPPLVEGEVPWMTNAKDPTTGEHYTHGEGRLTYKKVTVTKPAGKGCKVFEAEKEVNPEMVTTKKLKASTTKVEGKGTEPGMGLKFEPAEKTVFAEFHITGCSKAELNGNYKAEGSLVADLAGATVVATASKVKEQATLKLRGQLAQLDGSITLKARDPKVDPVGNYTTLSVTTVKTP